jgi:hypothetical protein
MMICINLKEHHRPHILPCQECAADCARENSIDTNAPTLEQFMRIVR